MAVSLDSIIQALRTIKAPGSDNNVMALGLVHDLKIEKDKVSLRLDVPQLEPMVKEALVKLAGATQADIKIEQKSGCGSEESSHHSHDHHHPHRNPATQEKVKISGINHIVAVSSGKGGVGKSTVALNLACAFAQSGHSVGLLDSDVYGPNIPTMIGLIRQTPQVRMDEKRGELIVPIEAYGVKVMSMGFLTKEDQPLIWRGPMLHSVVNQFLMQVDWGNLDYLIVDMPPGTGDVQLSLTQLVPLSGAVVVTTPQEVSLQDVRKAILMFEKVGVKVLGVVENMSYFICDECNKNHDIFGKGGGALLADKFRIPLLGQLPLVGAARIAGDQGKPVALGNATLSKEFSQIAQRVDKILLAKVL